jgi:hypothetical protein
MVTQRRCHQLQSPCLSIAAYEIDTRPWLRQRLGRAMHDGTVSRVQRIVLVRASLSEVGCANNRERANLLPPPTVYARTLC